MIRSDVEQERNQNDENEDTKKGKTIHSVILELVMGFQDCFL